ncbi:unnamed protein product [Adineta steineri]|uniref:Uncharacterized protein n=1 Tax=Adineta steineri TaxID=433720 RepID=A0A818HLP6_9BILA|nr:unnamed protein product [Adineta steineri]
MDEILDFSFEDTSSNDQQQPFSASDLPSDDAVNNLLSNLDLFSNNPLHDYIPIPLNQNNHIDENINIDELINPTNNEQINFLTLNLNEPSGESIDRDEISQLIDSYNIGEPSQQSTFIEHYENTSLEQSQQSSFIEHDDSSSFYQPQSIYSSPVSVRIGSSPAEPQVNETIRSTQAYLNGQNEIYRMASKPKKNKKLQQRSTTVAPIEYYMQSGDCQPCVTQLQSDLAYQQQTLEYEVTETKPIQIKEQPRAKYRPRTQNESKISAHYIRCEEGITPGYPTIMMRRDWVFQADVNIIEVTLVGIDQQPHPYTLHNKDCSATFEENTLIFKQHEPNILYFRLTNEDFLNGYKTLMIELIKGKQSDVITKELIRSRQLESSMLRLTRIFQVGKGEYQRDEGSVVYSNVMTEAYGDVDIEHMGPRYGPMSGLEMVYIVLKGQVLKNDIKIEVNVPYFNWNYPVENFTKNGKVIYFQMPPFPHPGYETAKANIIILHKGEELTQSPYLYKGSLDRELAELSLNDSPPTTTSSLSLSSSSSSSSVAGMPKFEPFDFLFHSNALSNSRTQKTSTNKSTKRLKK